MRLSLKLFLSLWLVNALYVTPAGGVTPNRYVDLVHSIVNEGRFAIDTYHANTIDKAYYDGHYYAGALPGPSALAAPAYVVFKGIYALAPSSLKQVAGGIQSFQKDRRADSTFYGQIDNVEFFLSQMFLHLTVVAAVSALSGVLVFKTVLRLRYSMQVALISTLLYNFGTIVFFYSTLFFEQIFSAAIAIGAFYLTLKWVTNLGTISRARDLVIIGLVASGAFLVEYTTVFVAFWLGVWLLWRGARGGLVYYALGFVPAVFLHMGYSWVLFHTPFSTPYAHLVEEFDAVHGVGFFGATFPQPERMFELWLGAERGLIWYMPVLLIAFVGILNQIVRRKTSRRAAWIMLGIIATYLFFYASYTNWRGGAAFGPRYLIPMLPILCLGIAFAFECLSRWLIYGVGLVSVGINWLGAQFGFATSIFEHLDTLMLQGPMLPVFGAVLSHTVTENALTRFVQTTYPIVTIGLTIVVVLFLIWWWRDLWKKPFTIHG